MRDDLDGACNAPVPTVEELVLPRRGGLGGQPRRPRRATWVSSSVYPRAGGRSDAGNISLTPMYPIAYAGAKGWTSPAKSLPGRCPCCGMWPGISSRLPCPRGNPAPLRSGVDHLNGSNDGRALRSRAGPHPGRQAPFIALRAQVYVVNPRSPRQDPKPGRRLARPDLQPHGA